MVREKSDEGIVVNQPAGHWEAGESLIDAVVRDHDLFGGAAKAQQALASLFADTDENAGHAFPDSVAPLMAFPFLDAAYACSAGDVATERSAGEPGEDGGSCIVPVD